MILPIVAYGDPVLRKVARPIGKNEINVAEFVANLYDTMYEASGVGLAAPQVGQSIRIFVVDGTPLNEDEEEEDKDPTLEGFKKVFINPQIIDDDGDEWAFEEGCLSIPGIRADVYRPEQITIRYRDMDWNEVTETYEGMAARIIQHEYDHLEGKLFTDHLSLLKRQMLKKKLADITKGAVQTEYRMKFPK
jgi:peptide deformylase